jgi:hypothetical protein
MPFFKRILKFDQHTISIQEKRYASRFSINPESSLKASLSFDLLKVEGNVLNFSSQGLAIILPKEFACPKDTPCVITLTHEGRKLTLNASISHQRTTPTGKKIGLKLVLDDFDTRLNFLQFIEPIAIGAALTPARTQSARFNEPELITRKYHASNNTILTLWMDSAGIAITGFELQMHEYYVRNGRTPPELLIFIHDDQAKPNKLGYNDPTLKRTSEEHSEIRQLFESIIPHLSDKIPSEMRVFLEQYTSKARP